MPKINKSLLFLFLGFFLIFAGFDSAQYYLSSIFYTQDIKTISLVSFSLIYSLLAITTVFSSRICKKIGIKKSLILASILYALFIISLISKNSILIYILSVLLGIAAGIIWTAQGIYLIWHTNDKNRGMYSGIFFSLLPIGPAILTYVISLFIGSTNYQIIYLGLFALALIGSFMMNFIAKQENPIEEKQLSIFKRFKDKRILKLFPYIFGSAFVFGLILSVLPIQITKLYGLGQVGKLVSLFSFSGIIICLSVGKLIDRFGPKIFVLLSTVSGLLGLSLILFSQSIYIYYIAILLLVFNYSSLVVVSYPMIVLLCKEDISSFVAIRWMGFGLAVALCAILSLILTFETMIIINIAVLLLALIFAIKPYLR